MIKNFPPHTIIALQGAAISSDVFAVTAQTRVSDAALNADDCSLVLIYLQCDILRK